MQIARTVNKYNEKNEGLNIRVRLQTKADAEKFVQQLKEWASAPNPHEQTATA
jgi:hypothetical protein